MTTIREQVGFDTTAKAQLENQLRQCIRKFNAKLLRVYKKAIIQTGGVTIVNLDIFQDELESILNRHFIRVGQIFVNRMNDLVESEIKQLESKSFEFKARKTNTPIPVVVSRYYNARASDQARKITETSKQHARKALAEAIKITATSQTAVTELEIASQAGPIFQVLLNSRETSIARLNTNAPAEVAKLTQIEVLRGEEPSLSGGSGSKGTKRWNNLADNRVRDGSSGPFNHLTAIQVVSISEPFTVSGEKLRFPGDTGLGASSGNVVNCRCSASYDIASTARIVRNRRKGILPSFSIK